MSPVFLLAIGLCTLGVVALLFWALRGSFQPPALKDGLKVLENAPQHLFNMAQIRQGMDPEDLKYVASKGGARLAATLRRERRRVALMYLSAIRLDFEIRRIDTEAGNRLLPYGKFRHGRVWLSDDANRIPLRAEVEIFDLSHIHGAKRLIDAGLMSQRPHIQFVMGVQNALPADEHLLDILLEQTKRIIPGATWTAAGIGRHQSQVMQWALARGADAVRTGMEDNIRTSRDRLASGNDELVRIAVGLLERFSCRPATQAEARSSLGLQSA